ncbi:MAG: DUF3078 domain-containing protein [Deferribacteres bacterium]|nr:DUF3078 domain-containing protein [candidate division KSB1 bacterium]MCB9501101.1 DUF3078 domain-containing protein [Deferribacteres bacterium]
MLRQSCYVILFLMIMASSIVAKEKKDEKFGWDNKLVGALNMSQISFDNWAKGGENTVTWQILVTSKFEKNEKRYNWRTSTKFNFGKTKVDGFSFRKSMDEIKLETVMTYKMDSYINPYGALTVQTQFAGGYKYIDKSSKKQVSAFLDPGYFTQSTGFGIEPTKGLRTRAGLSYKQTVTSDFPKPFADDPKTEKIEKIKTEVGFESTTDFSHKLSDNLRLTSKLEMFSNLEAFDEIDVNWDNMFRARVAKYVSVNMNFRLLYDKTVSLKRQINQSLALGLTYTFI